MDNFAAARSFYLPTSPVARGLVCFNTVALLAFAQCQVMEARKTMAAGEGEGEILLHALQLAVFAGEIAWAYAYLTTAIRLPFIDRRRLLLAEIPASVRDIHDLAILHDYPWRGLVKSFVSDTQWTRTLVRWRISIGRTLKLLEAGHVDTVTNEEELQYWRDHLLVLQAEVRHQLDQGV